MFYGTQMFLRICSGKFPKRYIVMIRTRSFGIAGFTTFIFCFYFDLFYYRSKMSMLHYAIEYIFDYLFEYLIECLRSGRQQQQQHQQIQTENECKSLPTDSSTSPGKLY